MKKEYILFAGVNGSGKTTLYKSYLCDKSQPRINSDEILRSQNGSWMSSVDQAAAMKEAVRRIREYLDRGVSFNQETTLTGKSILNYIRQAKGKGYLVKMYYVGLESADLAVQRVAQRVRMGGHGIREEDIRRRYVQSLENLKIVVPMCDFVKIYDNTIQFEPIASFEQGVLVDGDCSRWEWLKNVFSSEKEFIWKNREAK